MRSRGVVVVLACLLLVLAGCGVAGDTGVTRDRDAARLGLSRADADMAEPRGRAQSNDAVEMVANYLRAAAGEREHVLDRVRDFLLPGIRGTFNPGPEIVVVRQIGGLVVSPKAGGSSNVRVELQRVGVLTEHGAIKPKGAGEQDRFQHTFVVSPGEAGQPGFYLSQPYEQLLLSTSALAPGRADQDSDVLYRPHLLYFWDTEQRTLVPDLRYLPRSMERAQRPTEVVRRLLAGPSEWLKPAVQAPPDGTEVRGNVVLKGDRVVVDLNAKAAAGAISPQKLLAQLRWSLWEWHQYDPIILQIEGQERAADPPAGSANRSDNPAAELKSNPASFCIADGFVRAECTDPAVSPASAILDSPENQHVRSAAITYRDDGRYAALVRAVGNRRTLFVGRAQPAEAAPTYVPTALSGSLSRPVWLNRTESPVKGLIVADGRLYWFDVEGRVGPLQGAVGGIQAVAVAPDARRIAFIAGGSVYVAPLSTQRGGVLTVGGAQRLQTTVAGLTAVGFSRPERLFVAGTGSLAELSVDGAIEEQVHGLGDSKVTALASYPDNPANGSTRGAVLIEIADAASQVFATQLQPIKWRGPAPASLPPGGQKPEPRVTSAFFEG